MMIQPPRQNDIREDELGRFLDADATGHYTKWCRAVIERHSPSRNTSEDGQQLVRLLRKVLRARELEEHSRAIVRSAERDIKQPPPIKMTAETEIVSGADRRRTFEMRRAELSARHLELHQCELWIRSARDAAVDLFAGVQALCALVEGVEVWRNSAIEKWTPADSIDAALETSKIFYEGVYTKWRRGWCEGIPLSSDEIRAAANELVSRLEHVLGLTGRLVVHNVGPYDAGLQELSAIGVPPPIVMPLTFFVKPALPDGQQRKALVRAWMEEAVSR